MDKIKVPPVLKYCTIKVYVGVQAQFHTFYTSVLDCIEWIQSLSGHREKFHRLVTLLIKLAVYI
jgi:hypothetical protein